MAKYRVWAECVSDVYLDVEADSKEEAYEKAQDTDGGCFIEDPTGGGWKLTDVVKLS